LLPSDVETECIGARRKSPAIVIYLVDMLNRVGKEAKAVETGLFFRIKL